MYDTHNVRQIQISGPTRNNIPCMWLIMLDSHNGAGMHQASTWQHENDKIASTDLTIIKKKKNYDARSDCLTLSSSLLLSSLVFRWSSPVCWKNGNSTNEHTEKKGISIRLPNEANQVIKQHLHYDITPTNSHFYQNGWMPLKFPNMDRQQSIKYQPDFNIFNNNITID